MFTGLIENKGTIRSRKMEGGSGALVLEARGWDRPIEIGESIAVQGVCLTVTEVEGDRLSFDVLGETFRCTNLGEKEEGSSLNLERALRNGDPLGGHMVQGHVDGVGEVREIRPVDRDHVVRVTCDASILRYLVYKGSIAVDGISLTVAALGDGTFSVHIIPHTWEATTFGDLREGDAVNLEADPLAKYVEKALQAGHAVTPIDWDIIRTAGYDRLSSGEPSR